MDLAGIIRHEIRDRGPMSFARFMELALYHPQLGYYARTDRVIGRAGDFYTSVSVGPLFGELLGVRFARWLETLPRGPVCIVEAGAHSGQLARDLLRCLARTEPDLCARLEYWIVEPQAGWRNTQAATLAEAGVPIRWLSGSDDLAGVRGIIFGNELLDALPVRSWSWSRAESAWRERCVVESGDRFGWTTVPPDADPTAVPDTPDEVKAVLPDGFQIETSEAAARWWTHMASALEAGWLVALDYGDAPSGCWTPGRQGGTLRGYRAHRPSDDLLAVPGDQDLTAHVDFGRIQRAGEQAGLRTVVFWPQALFLVEAVRAIEVRAAGAFAWTLARRRQLATLLHPQHLGRAFHVLVQQR